MITLHFYNTIACMDVVVTPEINKEILLHARQGEFINLYHYCNDYQEDEYRKVLDIKYNGGTKHIYLSGHRH